MCVELCFRIGWTGWETQGIFKTAFGDHAIGRTYSFLDSNLGNLRLKTVSVQVSPQIARMKGWRMLANSTNADEVPFRRGRWHVRPLKWNMPVNSKGGLKHEAHLREVCASNAHQRQLPADKTTAVVLHPFSSPDLTPYNFFSSPRIKPKLWRRPLQDDPEIQEKWLTALHAIPKKKVGFSGISGSGRIAWTRCI